MLSVRMAQNSWQKPWVRGACRWQEWVVNRHQRDGVTQQSAFATTLVCQHYFYFHYAVTLTRCLLLLRMLLNTIPPAALLPSCIVRAHTHTCACRRFLLPLLRCRLTTKQPVLVGLTVGPPFATSMVLVV